MSPHSTGSNGSERRSSQNIDREIIDTPNVVDIFDTPLGIAKFEHSSLKSFNAGVQDLTQDYPDTTVGGMPAITSIAKLRDSFESLSYNLRKGKQLIAQHSIARSQSWCSSASVLMITAPETPLTENEGGEHAVGIAACQEVELNMPNTLGHLYDPKSQASTSQQLCQVPNLDGANPRACCELMEDEESVCSVSTGQYCPGSNLCPENPMNMSTVTMAPNPLEPSALATGSVGVDPSKVLKNAEGHITALPSTLNLPVDGTGILSAPPTPKPRRRTRGKEKFLKSVRKTRAACCKRPVMSVVIGRQLASPVSSALQAIAREEIPDFTEFLPIASSEIRAPVPLPA